IHEDATYSTNIPFMGIFNNLVMYDQADSKNTIESIVPDLATSWQWNANKTKLTFKLRQGVKWHDGKPFTAKDVQCTFDMLQGKGKNKLRKNPRKAWYGNLDSVSTKGDFEATFNLKRTQPAFIALLASGYTPIYPCHVDAGKQRTSPIGTGPFKFVEYKLNQSIKVTRNPNYWKKDRPFLDGIEYTIIKNRSTAALAFVSGKTDMGFPMSFTVPMVRDIKKQLPEAVCQIQTTNVSTNLVVNRDAPPFNNEDIRRAMAMALDRKAFVDILFEGQADIGGAMLPRPNGVWGMPIELLRIMPGYNPNVKASRDEARELMKKAGYGPNKRLKIKVSTRNLGIYRDPAVILIDQLKDIYIDGELDVVESANWFTKMARKDYSVGLNLTGSAVDDPDQNFYENYACGSQRNYTKYCNKDLEKLFDAQSMESDFEKRKALVWEIDKKLQEDVARPIIYHSREGTCYRPYVKGIVVMQNSSYNGYRYEDVWLDK
ncbi:MAG: ABC transporter substrate-binding protein, partial [Quisquiliibacterium sp.]